MNETLEQIHALADGQASGEAKQEALAAVAADPKARAEYEWALYLRRELPNKLTPCRNDEAWKSTKARLDAIDRTRTAESFVGRWAWAFCAIFFVGILSAAVVNRTSGARPLSTSQAAGLFTALEPMNVEEPAQALEIVRQSTGIAPNRVANLKGDIREISCGTVGGRKAARLTLDDGRGRMALFVIAETTAVEGIDQNQANYQAGTINNVPAVSWRDQGFLMLLVGRRDLNDLRAAADQIRSWR
ncbi:MAG: hypothetical protein KIT11_10420 [Fimbriimonadaceae bacterium]|nr:hypothetical protein [Fimbriimonadaceae bacterium]QYK55736.1 MAG: hypothetical protein KF733_12090 [Fimbriimonadaceae bacterium]